MPDLINPITGKPYISASTIPTLNKNKAPLLNPITGEPYSNVHTPAGSFAGNVLTDVRNIKLDDVPSYTDRGIMLSPNYSNQFNDMRAERQTWYDKIANGAAKMTGLATTTFVGSFVDLAFGLQYATATNEFKGMYDNDVTKAFDEFGEFMEKIHPNYYTQKEIDAPAFSWENIGNANFIGDKFLKNLGFSIGAVGSAVVMGYLTGGTGATGIISRIGTYANRLTKLASAGKTTQFALATGKNLMSELAMANRLYKGTKAVNLLWESFNASHYEAGMEARMLGNTMEEKWRKSGLYNEAQIKEMSSSIMNQSFLLNTALLSISNMAQFGKLFNSGYKVEKNMFNKMFLNKVTGKVDQKIPNWLVKNKIYMTTPFVEGWEEGSQFVIQKHGEYKYDNVLDKSIGAWGQAINDLVGTKEGQENMILGFLTGGLFGGGTNYFFSKAQGTTSGAITRNTQYAIDELNNELVSNPDGFVAQYLNRTYDTYKTAVANSKSNDEQEKAIAASDVFEFKNLENNDIMRMISLYSKYGQYDVLREQIADWGSLNDEEFKKGLGYQGKESPSSYTAKLLNKLDKLNNLYDQLQYRFPNAKTWRFKGSDETFNMRERLFETMGTLINLEGRQEELKNKLHSITTDTDGNILVNWDNIMRNELVSTYDFEKQEEYHRLEDEKYAAIEKLYTDLLAKKVTVEQAQVEIARIQDEFNNKVIKVIPEGFQKEIETSFNSLIEAMSKGKLSVAQTEGTVDEVKTLVADLTRIKSLSTEMQVMYKDLIEGKFDKRQEERLAEEEKDAHKEFISKISTMDREELDKLTKEEKTKYSRYIKTRNKQLDIQDKIKESTQPKDELQTLVDGLNEDAITVLNSIDATNIPLIDKVKNLTADHIKDFTTTIEGAIAKGKSDPEFLARNQSKIDAFQSLIDIYNYINKPTVPKSPLNYTKEELEADPNKVAELKDGLVKIKNKYTYKKGTVRSIKGSKDNERLANATKFLADLNKIKETPSYEYTDFANLVDVAIQWVEKQINIINSKNKNNKPTNPNPTTTITPEVDFVDYNGTNVFIVDFIFDTTGRPVEYEIDESTGFIYLSKEAADKLNFIINDVQVGDEVVIKTDKEHKDSRYTGDKLTERNNNKSVIPIIITKDGKRIAMFNEQRHIHDGVIYTDENFDPKVWSESILLDQLQIILDNWKELVAYVDEFTKTGKSKFVFTDKEMSDLLEELINTNRSKTDSLKPNQYGKAIAHLYQQLSKGNPILPNIATVQKRLQSWTNKIKNDIEGTNKVRNSIDNSGNLEIKGTIEGKSRGSIITTKGRRLLTDVIKGASNISNIQLMHFATNDPTRSTLIDLRTGTTAKYKNTITGEDAEYEVRERSTSIYIAIDAGDGSKIAFPIKYGLIGQDLNKNNKGYIKFVTDRINKIIEILGNSEATDSDFITIEDIVNSELGSIINVSMSSFLFDKKNIKNRKLTLTSVELNKSTGKYENVKYVIKTSGETTSISRNGKDITTSKNTDKYKTTLNTIVSGLVRQVNIDKTTLTARPDEDIFTDPVTGEEYSSYIEYLITTGALNTDVGAIVDPKGNIITNMHPKGDRPISLHIKTELDTEVKPKAKPKSKAKPKTKPAKVTEVTKESTLEGLKQYLIDKEFRSIINEALEYGTTIDFEPKTPKELVDIWNSVPNIKDKIADNSLDKALAVYMPGLNRIFFTHKGLSRPADDIVEDLVHESFHSLINNHYVTNKIADAEEADRLRQEVKNDLVDWKKSVEEADWSNLNIQEIAALKNYLSKIDDTNKGFDESAIEELFAYAFEGRIYGNILSKIEGKDNGKIKKGGIADRLLSLIKKIFNAVKKVYNIKTSKFDELMVIADKYFTEVETKITPEVKPKKGNFPKMKSDVLTDTQITDNEVQDRINFCK